MLALAAWGIAYRLEELARHELAVELYDQCVMLFRDLDENFGRGEFANDLASALMNKGVALDSLGRLDAAMGCYDEAIAVRRDLVENRGRAELANDLAAALVNKSVALGRSGRLDAAMGCNDKAITILRDLVKNRGRAELANDLAAALMNKGVALGRLGRLDGPVGCYDEAITILRDLVESRGRAVLANELAKTLMNKGVALKSGQYFRDAVANCDEAGAIYWQLFAVPRYEILPDLLLASANRWDVAVAQDDWQSAVSAALVSIFAVFTKQRATEITPPDQQQLAQLVVWFRRLTVEQREQLLAAAGEHADLFRPAFGDS